MRGDGQSFGLDEGLEIRSSRPTADACPATGFPTSFPDVRADERAASVPVTAEADLAAFASVPITFSDGELYGTLRKP